MPVRLPLSPLENPYLNCRCVYHQVLQLPAYYKYRYAFFYYIRLLNFAEHIGAQRKAFVVGTPFHFGYTHVSSTRQQVIFLIVVLVRSTFYVYLAQHPISKCIIYLYGTGVAAALFIYYFATLQGNRSRAGIIGKLCRIAVTAFSFETCTIYSKTVSSGFFGSRFYYKLLYRKHHQCQ